MHFATAHHAEGFGGAALGDISGLAGQCASFVDPFAGSSDVGNGDGSDGRKLQKIFVKNFTLQLSNQGASTLLCHYIEACKFLRKPHFL